MNREIIVKPTFHYGVERFQVISDHANPLTGLLRTKTIDMDQIRKLKQLGFSVHQRIEERTF